jgi:hypothetical protein
MEPSSVHDKSLPRDSGIELPRPSKCNVNAMVHPSIVETIATPLPPDQQENGDKIARVNREAVLDDTHHPNRSLANKETSTISRVMHVRRPSKQKTHYVAPVMDDNEGKRALLDDTMTNESSKVESNGVDQKTSMSHQDLTVQVRDEATHEIIYIYIVMNTIGLLRMK